MTTITTSYLDRKRRFGDEPKRMTGFVVVEVTHTFEILGILIGKS